MADPSKRQKDRDTVLWQSYEVDYVVRQLCKEYPTNQRSVIVNVVAWSGLDRRWKRYHRSDPAFWMWERETYLPPQKLGDVMRGICVGTVVESNNPALQVGFSAFSTMYGTTSE